jgi:hypothetical protein
MNLQEIEKILEKYYNGETTLDEEKQLRMFFAGSEVPAQWKHLAGFFSYVGQEKEVKIESPEFERKFDATVGETRLSKIFDLRRPWIYWMAGVAASVLIMVAIFVKFDPLSGKINDTYDNPEVAYVQAKKILMFVSTQMNKGTKDLHQIDKFEKGLQDVQAISSFNNSLEGVSRIGEMDKIKQLISNN